MIKDYNSFLNGLSSFVKEWKAETNPYVKFEKYLGDTPFDKFVLTEPCPALSWNDFLQWVNELEGSWCFRGQRDASWNLHTSLDRAIHVKYSKSYEDGSFSSGSWYLDHKSEQHELLSRFQEQAPRYLSDLPAIDDHASWLALMQHYGVPTCLLDWTQSPYVALYFALINEPHEAAAVWALNLDWLEAKRKEVLGAEASTPAKALNSLLEIDKPVIVQIEIDPFKMNERISAQQGVLLCNLIPGVTFNQILMSMMR